MYKPGEKLICTKNSIIYIIIDKDPNNYLLKPTLMSIRIVVPRSEVESPMWKKYEGEVYDKNTITNNRKNSQKSRRIKTNPPICQGDNLSNNGSKSRGSSTSNGGRSQVYWSAPSRGRWKRKKKNTRNFKISPSNQNF
jgi:hypothetical protein